LLIADLRWRPCPFAVEENSMTDSNGDNFNLKSYLALRKDWIDQTLAEILKLTSKPRRIIRAMEYSLMAGGKRIRPILCLAAAEAVGGNAEDALPAACAVEMIHTYSLIHDDLPAMDDDALRRGQPTCHKAFNEATAILAGDGLLTLAFQTLSANDTTKKQSSSTWLEVVHAYAFAAGYEGMIEGQMLDTALEGAQIALKELEEMHALKTGALFNASVYAGAVIGGGTKMQIEKLKAYAGHIGLAFQVSDDILNIEGNPALMGKATGSDAERQKCTYPSLMGLEQSKELANQLINSALHALEIFDNRSDSLRAIARYIIERNN